MSGIPKRNCFINFSYCLRYQDIRFPITVSGGEVDGMNYYL